MSRSKKQIQLDIPPHNPSGWQIPIKGIIWLIVGLVISLLIFVVLILVWWVIEQALADSLSGNFTINPLLPLILLVIAFLGTFIGNLVLAGVFNLVYTDKYYDMKKMFSISLMINILLFFFFVPLYLLFTGSVTPLFLILAMHIIITVFLCYIGIEISTNPNYAVSHLIWWALGFCVAVFVFALVYKLISLSWWQQINLIMAIPPILAYFLIPLFHGIREKIYHKLYSSGNNFLYVPSLSEVLVDAEDSSEVNVSM